MAPPSEAGGGDQAPPAAMAIPRGPAPEVLDMVDVNRAILSRYQEKLQAIESHNLQVEGTALRAACPPEIGVRGATGHPFDAREFQTCMKNRAERPEYKCMVNLFWLDILRLAVPGIPLNQGAIDHFRKHFFGEGPQPIPAQTPLTIVVAPDDVVGGLAPPLERLRRASGCEAVLAFIDAAAAAIADDPSSVVAKGWANAALQTPAIFVNFGGAEPDILKYAIQAKHDWKKVGDAMAPNTLQFIYQIMVTKNLVAQNSRKGELKHDIEEFYKGIRVADDDQKVTAEVAARCAKLFHELLSNEKAAHNMREHIQQQRDWLSPG